MAKKSIGHHGLAKNAKVSSFLKTYFLSSLDPSDAMPVDEYAEPHTMKRVIPEAIAK